MNTKTIVVVDDDPSFLRSVASMLESAHYEVRAFESAFRFYAECGQVADASCVLLDERLENESGLDVYRELRHRGIQLPVIMVTGYATVPLAVSALDSGVAYLMEKPVEGPVLMARIQRCIEEAADRRQHEVWRETQQRQLDRLSEQELQVVHMVANGQLNKQIAKRMNVSTRTVENYRKRVLKKVGAQSVADLVVFAVATGIRDVPGLRGDHLEPPHHGRHS